MMSSTKYFYLKLKGENSYILLHQSVFESVANSFFRVKLFKIIFLFFKALYIFDLDTP